MSLRLAFAACLAATPSVAEEIGIEALPRLDADVIVIGETHDNPDHHLNQAAAVAALRPAALVFEMFGPDAALNATADIRGNAEKLSEALGWADGGWPDFSMYHAIFLAAPDAAIFGGALPREEVRRAVGDGAASVFGDGATLFGLDTPLPEDESRTREAGQMAAHCDALPEDILPGMVEAQRLRDAALARAVVAAMAETGGPVVVIAGNGHARRDWGVPHMLSRALPDADVISVGQFETPPGDDAPYDHWLLSPAPPRDGDPCDALRQ